MIIKNVLEMDQCGQKLYYFQLGAEDLLQVTKILHFGQHPEGVNRMFDYHHAQGLARFMSQHNSRLFDPILGDINEGWEYDPEKGTLTASDEARIIIDDGQHRIAALQMLGPGQRERWKFMVFVTMGLPYKERLKIFAQQGLRKKLDPRLTLQIADATDTFRDIYTKNAYHIIKRLNEEKGSPLYTMIWLEEKVPGGPPADSTDIGLLKDIQGLSIPAFRLRQPRSFRINVMAIIGPLKQLLSSLNSPLRGYDTEGCYESVKIVLQAAKETWKDPWEWPNKHFLCRSTGIGALIKLMLIGSGFRDKVGAIGWKSEEKMKEIFKKISFDWSFEQFRNKSDVKFPTAVEIAQKLDMAIIRSK
jgi:DGQHR domain-containing protein